MPALFASLDIYVSPSHTESFGIATLEAMAVGTPVVATRTDGSLELLRDEQFLVPVENPVALAARISAMMEDEEQRRTISEVLKTRAAEEYSIEKMVESVESLYREVLQD